ncbi:MAG: hypothetical protein WDO71_03850 [Bacteroidota bacterium]
MKILNRDTVYIRHFSHPVLLGNDQDKFDIAEYIEGAKEMVQDIWVLKKQ